MKYCYSFFCLLFLAGSVLSAQDDTVLGPGEGSSQLMIGLFGGIVTSNHKGQFTLVEEGITCCEFDGASGTGPTAALRVQYNLSEQSPWSLAARIGWEDHSAEFETEVEQLLIFGENNKPELADFQNRLSASLSGITISPLIMYKILDFDLYLSVGPSITLYGSPSFDKTEQIVGPEGVTYLDGTTELLIPDVTIDGVGSSYIGANAGVDLRYPLTDKLGIGLELLYRIPLTKIAPDEEWKVSNLIATAGFSLSL